MPLEPGQTLSHYRLEEKLGEGGMGVVWRARDARLDRPVALKTLPPGVAEDATRRTRFRREARAVAALNHPNIVTIYSVEEAEGIYFLTMELVEGESLDRSILAGALPLARVVDIGIALADALAAAHEKGIVHRDLKPANIMITSDGRVKVLDFGLAKLVGEVVSTGQTVTRASPITKAGALLGTVPYMSPEQLRGQDLDPRSDVFSLGIVLYELTTGRRPFEGPTDADVASAILSNTPPSITQVKSDLPHHLGRIVAQCLEKDPSQRVPSAVDVGNELRSLRRQAGPGSSEMQLDPTATLTPPPGTPVARRGQGKGRWIGLAAAAVVVAAVAVVLIGRDRGLVGNVAPIRSGSGAARPDVDPHSIAVLPFVNMSSDKEQDYFSDGISEQLLNLLARIPELKVAARTSSFSFKNKEVEIPEIARQLHVAHVLEGSVRKSGNRIRITAQLILAEDGFHLWSQTYDRTLDDIFRVQDEIAADVVKELQVTLLGATPKSRTTDPHAYALYLQAAQLGRQVTTEALADSTSLYHRVLSADSRYAEAWVGLAKNFINEASIGMLSNEEGYARARGAAEKALEIDPEYAAAHGALAWITMYGDNDLAGAARDFEHALALDPADLDVLGNAAALLQSLGRMDEALALKEAVTRRDPVNVSALYNLGIAQLWANQFDAAIASFRTVLSLSPGRGGAHFNLGVALLLHGDATAALAEIEQDTSEFLRMLGLPLAYHALGRRAESDEALAALIAADEKDAAYNIASVHAFRGEVDEAFAWLDKAVAYGDPGLSEILAERLFLNVHSDPRWLPFLRKIGKSPDELARIQFRVAGFEPLSD